VIEKTTYLTIMFRFLCGEAGKSAPGTHHLACRVELASAELSYPFKAPEHGGVIGLGCFKVRVRTIPDDHRDGGQAASGTAVPVQ